MGCEQSKLPIAVKYEDRPAVLDTFQAHVATGHGAYLPTILGLRSMQDKDSVLCMRKGKEFLAFLGPGGYKIEWSPGNSNLPLENAPSGHLVVPCDKFEDIDNNSKGEQLAFLMDFIVGDGRWQ